MKCNRCKAEKPESEFVSGSKRCSKCRVYLAKYYKKNRRASIERATKSQNKDRDRTNAYKRSLIRKNPVNYMFGQVKSRAKKFGIEFDIEKSDIQIPDICPVLGLRLEIGNIKCHSSSPTLDRIDSSKGYVKGNVHVISHKANTIKSNASLEDLQKVVDFLRAMSLRL